MSKIADEMLIQEAKRIISETLAASELFEKQGARPSLPRRERGSETGATRSDSNSSSSSSISSTPGSTRRPRCNTSDSSDCEAAVVHRPLVNSSCSGSSSGASARCGSSTASSSDFTTEISRTKPVDLPLVIATGIVPGTAEDVAFGALAYTERITRLRDAHIQEKYEGVKVLATILRPTAQDPFQSLVVKWMCKNVGALSRMRDHVFIEANGISVDSKGEMVAYHLVHSIDSIPRIPGFKHLDITRVDMSMCMTQEQRNDFALTKIGNTFVCEVIPTC